MHPTSLDLAEKLKCSPFRGYAVPNGGWLVATHKATHKVTGECW